VSSGRGVALLLPGFLLASAAIAGVAGVVALRRYPAAMATAGALERVPSPRLTPPEIPLRAEAQVFRLTPGVLALEPAAPRERSAHPRNLGTYRFLRGYPGAPPRIPHALRPEEFRTQSCRTCHERGGYSIRFAAYVPVTPHPERGVCLQCHLGEDSLMAIPVPSADPNRRCPQCHGLGGAPRREASLTWPTSVWPELPPLIRDQYPPPIPHDLLFRENCLACHSGPAAVAPIRTSHPERANCRQCHLTQEAGVTPFRRPMPDSQPGEAAP
jgi:cytochrome c-type protein NapB